MATAKMKPSVSDRTQHFVIVEVDDAAAEEILTANADEADSLAQAVIDAAAARSTIVIPVGDTAAGGFVVSGHIVLDLAKSRRTAVRVASRSLQFASMGIKK